MVYAAPVPTSCEMGNVMKISSVGSTASLSQHVQLHSAGKCRINIKFLVIFKKSVTKIFQIVLKACGDETLLRAYVFECHKWFSGGSDSVEDNQVAGRPRVHHGTLRTTCEITLMSISLNDELDTLWTTKCHSPKEHPEVLT
ncbi:hypothetical protein TNCV_968031 [Trichonephila clavipes]|nr:hypothetical protein TNCV_968031 [Trichonephila clavipes]